MNIYNKNFDKWNKEKQFVNKKEAIQEFSNGEVWWVKFGINIGSEQDGIGDDFERPVVILKKFSSSTFLSVPLTTKKKENKYRVDLSANNNQSYAIVDQMRVLDSRRLIRKIGQADSVEFTKLKMAVNKLF